MKRVPEAGIQSAKRVSEAGTRSGYPKRVRLPEVATRSGYLKRVPEAGTPSEFVACTRTRYPLGVYTASGTLGGFVVASGVEIECVHRASANQMLRLQEARTAIFVAEIGPVTYTSFTSYTATPRQRALL